VGSPKEGLKLGTEGISSPADRTLPFCGTVKGEKPGEEEVLKGDSILPFSDVGNGEKLGMRMPAMMLSMHLEASRSLP